jgi:cytosine/adenosine deaminase-related metal-dependent hydrolase
LVREGLSPHAPYTTSAELLARAGALARERRLAISVHWAETASEREWLLDGAGELAPILPRSPGQSGLDLLALAGVLGRRTSLVHGNHPGRGEPARLARAGVTLVHCPGTHDFFARAPFPLERYRRAGVRVALGTDSLASNRQLDMRAELELFRRAFPRVPPGEVFAMATLHGARALGLPPPAGSLVPGAPADFVAHELAARTREEALEALTSGAGVVTGVWIAGRRAFPRPDPA